MRVDPNTSELQYSGRNCFMGYRNNERETTSTLDDEVFSKIKNRDSYILGIWQR